MRPRIRIAMAIALNLQRFRITNGVPKNNRSVRENRHGEAANVCDRSGSSVDERFAGWKASPSCWKDAGETEWWRHGRCGQVARKDAAGRSPVHPFAPFRPLATDCPLRRRSLYMPVFTYTRIHTHVDSSRISLFLFLSLRLVVSRPFSSPPVSRRFPLSLRWFVSALDPYVSAALTKLPVFVLREIAGYCTPRVNTIIDPLHFAPRANENLFLQGNTHTACPPRERVASCISFLSLLLFLGPRLGAYRMHVSVLMTSWKYSRTRETYRFMA